MIDGLAKDQLAETSRKDDSQSLIKKLLRLGEQGGILGATHSFAWFPNRS